MSCEQQKQLRGMIRAETDPHTKRILRFIDRYWRHPYGFEIPERNGFYITGGFYSRLELFPILTGGYKPIDDKDVRQQLVQTSRTVFKAMLLLEDGDPLFQIEFKDSVDNIDT